MSADCFFALCRFEPTDFLLNGLDDTKGSDEENSVEQALHNRRPEIDIHLHEDGFRVYHLLAVDPISTCYSLVDCATAIRDWSDAHRDHAPIPSLLLTSAVHHHLIRAKRQVVAAGEVDLAAGHEIAKRTCFICHKLFGEGGSIGPELTGYDRSNADFWLDNLFMPSMEIREGFGAYIVKTKGGQLLTGLMDAQDASGIVIKDMAGNKTALKQADIEKMEASPISLMPEGLTTGMSDADLKDLFAYLMRK